MLVTSREQKLISQFLKNKILTIAEMIEITETSRRTLYRDLEKLQASLPDGVSLRTSDEGYYLDGNLAVLGNVKELVEFSATERLHGELLLLLEDQASIISLTEEFGISQPTATADLRQIEESLQESGLSLERDRGLKISGAEEKIRSILVSSINNFCSISQALAGNFENNKILSLLNLDCFDQAKQIFEQVDLPEMTDKTRTLMQFFLTATLIRLSKGHQVKLDSVKRPSKQALSFVNSLVRHMSHQIFTIAEITSLAAVYDVLYFGYGRELLFMEKFDSDFSYKIRHLIDQVSNLLTLEFSKDDKLYGLLYAHLKETEVLPELFTDKKNDFVVKIKTDNSKIYQAVESALPEVFKKRFSSMEIAFVTLHFVATLERSDTVLPLHAALVTSRGRISCELLMSNLKKNFPFLKKIDLLQTSTNFNPDKYDAVFTTEIELEEYIYLNRNLEQKNLDSIRHQLRSIQQNIKTVRIDDSQKTIVNLNQLFSIGDGILESFSIQEIKNKNNLTATVKEVVKQVETSNPSSLGKLLQTRFEETHLAIPDTRIALLHGVHESVDFPVFKIFDLKEEVKVLAMNRKEIKVKRVLLLLSPPDVADYAAYLLGKISSSIIENKLYTTIYDSGNYAVVNELLRQIMTESIRNYGE